LENEKETKASKLIEFSTIIKHQDEMLTKQSTDLKNERKETEYMRNKLAVCLVQLKDFDCNNKQLFEEKTTIHKKFTNLQDFYLKQTGE